MASTRAATAAFLVAEILLLAAAQGGGGWPWTVIGGATITMLCLGPRRPESLALVAPGFLWLALSRSTGNRELFFPFTLHLASVVALRLGRRGPWQGAVGGGLIVGAFLAVRAAQHASAKVLAVELAVAGAILAAVVAGGALARGRLVREAAVVLGASLLAYAGLAL